jgi:hypothetical protein
MNVPDEGEKAGGGQEADAGDGEEVGDGGQLLCHRLELAFDLLDASLDVANLVTGLGEERSLGEVGVGILGEGPYRGDDLMGPTGMKTPSSRRRPLRALRRAVLSAIHPERRR